MNTIYFRLYLTENEHYIVEDELREYCQNNDMKLIYYRKLKNGHIPMVREIKVEGKKYQVQKFLEDRKMIQDLYDNKV